MCVGTLELMTLFVKRVLRISALWFISQIHEKANLENQRQNISTIYHWNILGKNTVLIIESMCSCVSVSRDFTFPHWSAENTDWSWAAQGPYLSSDGHRIKIICFLETNYLFINQSNQLFSGQGIHINCLSNIQNFNITQISISKYMYWIH